MRILTLLFRREAAVPAVALTFASVVTAALVIARVVWTGKLHYAFLIWNVFLAWLPLVFALLACERYRNGRVRDWPFFGFTAAWLLFFPNAPYIFTDLIHLTSRDFAHFWVDLVIFLCCAVTGLVLGFVSLYLIQCIVIKAFGRIASWFFIAGVAGLSSFGIYLGRFLRFNSWDVIVKPVALYHGIGGWITHPLQSSHTSVFPLLFAAFLFICYVMLYALTHLQPTSSTAFSDRQLTS